MSQGVECYSCLPKTAWPPTCFPTKEIANFSKDPNYAIVNEAGQGYVGFYVNVTKPPFDNKYLRQALDVLIDRDSLVKIVKDGAATSAHQPFPPEVGS